MSVHDITDRIREEVIGDWRKKKDISAEVSHGQQNLLTNANARL